MKREVLEIIKPHIKDIEKFVKTKELRPTDKANFWNDIKKAYALQGGDNITLKKLGKCSSCNKRVLNALFRQYEQSVLVSSNKGGADTPTEAKPKPKRGRPRKQNKPTRKSNGTSK